jgi:hypothetical protein
LRYSEAGGSVENDKINSCKRPHLAQSEHKPFMVLLPSQNVFNANHLFAKIEHPTHVRYKGDREHDHDDKASQ